MSVNAFPTRIRRDTTARCRTTCRFRMRRRSRRCDSTRMVTASVAKRTRTPRARTVQVTSFGRKNIATRRSDRRRTRPTPCLSAIKPRSSARRGRLARRSNAKSTTTWRRRKRRRTPSSVMRTKLNKRPSPSPLVKPSVSVCSTRSARGKPPRSPPRNSRRTRRRKRALNCRRARRDRSVVRPRRRFRRRLCTRRRTTLPWLRCAAPCSPSLRAITRGAPSRTSTAALRTKSWRRSETSSITVR
mmetsp:Transcript_3889/g.15013  ORF Transcript_3889/g.15013 Transcript_3889/m.15013 type:complete len:244 (-) Transcript_3889:235-966(-)